MSTGALAVPHPSKIICVGLNYRDHAQEIGVPAPATPVLFAKWPTCLIDDGAPIIIPPGVRQVDYEAELGVVIGRAGRDISADDALDFLAGYVAFNDISSRADQARDQQWTRGKSYDSFGPVGPRLVPVRDIPDPQALRITCRVDGQTVQDSDTSQMIFSVAELIATISRGTTLLPGDLIATGTPGGVGMSHTPPAWLTPGNLVEVEIEGIGILRNPIRAG